MPFNLAAFPNADVVAQLERLNGNIERYLRFLKVPSTLEDSKVPQSAFVDLPISEEEQAVKEYAKETGKGYVETE